MTAPARYVNGEPADLAAAAYDALEWLRWLGEVLARNATFRGPAYDDQRARLARATASLEAQVAPHLPPAFVTTRRRPIHTGG